jgi:hypothetical protein
LTAFEVNHFDSSSFDFQLTNNVSNQNHYCSVSRQKETAKKEKGQRARAKAGNYSLGCG